MTEVINLNKKRKAKARVDHEKTASQNRAKFGRSKQEKEWETLRSERAEKHLEGHNLSAKEDNGGSGGI